MYKIWNIMLNISNCIHYYDLYYQANIKHKIEYLVRHPVMHTKHINRDKKEEGKNQVTLALLWTNFPSYTTTNDIKEQKINYFFGNNSKDYRVFYDSHHNEISSICFHSWNLFNQNTYEKCKINKKRSPKKRKRKIN